jgi:hypothetical protein
MDFRGDAVRNHLHPGQRDMATRESFFECIFNPDGNEYRFHVRAWNAREAEEHIKASLRDNGVRENGALLIRDRKGAELLRSRYAFECG